LFNNIIAEIFPNLQKVSGGEMNQALYAHMNNKRKMKKKKEIFRRLTEHQIVRTKKEVPPDMS
jgi:hypothetical protein